MGEVTLELVLNMYRLALYLAQVEAGKRLGWSIDQR